MFASRFIIEALVKEYEPRGIRIEHDHGNGYQASDHAGVLGCLARSVPCEVQVPDTFSLGVAELQPFDPRIHKTPWVKCRIQKAIYVENRWRTLLQSVYSSLLV